ncbi:MAG TPA: hypothetical protein VFO10_18440 [Oligoflexus sp.]|uniref:hypothetical protein n=1 Tax=Oligoflexus sp. TaxID=1971216 RepID=UPI002D7E66A4|nr:hypothetical protein [Oligoflexus sp.]HET9239245.1 hypothetical protein [Oligoflexus sp.]
MKFKIAIACAIALTACGKDKSDNDNKSTNPISLVYPQVLDGSYVSVAGWELILPATDRKAEYRWSSDTLGKTVVTDLIPISAVSANGGNKADFLVQLISDQCQNYKSEPASGEIGGKTDSGANWFLRNVDSTFEGFTATARFGANCIELMIHPADKSFAAVPENSDLLRYFELVADGMKFNRFYFLRPGYQRISPFLFTSVGAGMTLVTDADGITSGSSESVVFTKDAQQNVLQSEARSGDCQKTIFQDAWNDTSMKDSEVKKGLIGKEKSGVESMEGGYSWATKGIFKTEDGAKCLIVTFSLKNPVSSEAVLKSDTDLASRLAIELGLTQRDDANQ